MSAIVRVDDADANIRDSGSCLPVITTSNYDNSGNFENNETTPLTLETLVVENGSIAGQQLQQIPSPSSTYTILPTNTTQKASSLNPNPIAGGVIAGAAIALLGVFALLLFRISAASRKHMAASTEFTSQHIPYTPPSGPIVRMPSMHKQKPPPARYMPPLSTAGSMRSYDPPSTAVPSVPERRSSNRSHQRELAPNTLGIKRQMLPKARSAGSSQNFISLNVLYSQDNARDQNPDLLPGSPISSTLK
ncbi:hypothetical protein BJ912DRAFT_136599 [Pholiota molesta]|nr:hypothetical protein BJ912DRAFT_136599 [Pholiota molesta]